MQSMSAFFFPAKRSARRAFFPRRFIPRGGLALPDYKFSTVKDPLFNSTRICKVSCKVEDHWQGHGCDCVRTDGNLGMLEQNLKGQYKRAYLDYSHCGKEST